MSRLNSLIILVISILSFLAPVMGNSFQFVSRDGNDHTIFFTPNAGSAEVPSFFVPASSMDENAVAHFPQGGSFKAVLSGESPDVPKVTGEITFQGWQGETYYTVSAVQNCCDNSGIRSLSSRFSSPTSGCIEALFPCTESYSKPGDVQVKSSPDTDYICLRRILVGISLNRGKPSNEEFAGHGKTHEEDKFAVAWTSLIWREEEFIGNQKWHKWHHRAGSSSVTLISIFQQHCIFINQMFP
ncbi:uncharacterized protein EAF01_010190 [Botrytis porri]|uniref:Uncharacterized protein n=1 Tax=Botrytis porri TaxID=87229 RepID=A0A4Z1KK32_9HELO|nr:uncharacterized protein EAF01_010190 [Botrytis porri]KAF7894740.1 hypothetical protein EAF01_010190 [Botrytis porri]TGO85928.1 hypothetical protein BPOR_0351g00110 [Botrytis porri]